MNDYEPGCNGELPVAFAKEAASAEKVVEHLRSGRLITFGDGETAARIIESQARQIAELEKAQSLFKDSEFFKVCERVVDLEKIRDFAATALGVVERRRDELRDERDALRRRITELEKPAHLREPPHCSSCECGLAPPPVVAPDDELSKYLAHLAGCMRNVLQTARDALDRDGAAMMVFARDAEAIQKAANQFAPTNGPPHDEHCDVNDPIIKGKPCNCRDRVPVETVPPQCGCTPGMDWHCPQAEHMKACTCPCHKRVAVSEEPSP